MRNKDKVKCNNCNNGKITIEVEETCSNCYGGGIIVCSDIWIDCHCNNGKVTKKEETCSDCGGSGYIEH